MFKDYHKYLKVSARVYIIVLIITFILKLIGLDYFHLDINNPIVLKLNKVFVKYNLINVWYFITLYIYTYCILAIATNNKNSKILSLIFTIVGVIIKVVEKLYFHSGIVALIDILYLYFMCLICNYKYKIRYILGRTTKVIILTMIYQLISMITRTNRLTNDTYTFIEYILLDLDYLLLCLITLTLYFREGRGNICTTEVGFSSLKKINLKQSLQELRKSYSSFKEKDRQYKASIIIYAIMSIFWNLFTLALVVFIAMLNNSFIECLYMMTSFWITKRTFGKAFHLESMIQCFVVSNVTYYTLNRIATPIGISIFIPIALGVGLSYITSKFVKKTYKPLYKGMSKELFDNTILKVTDKGSLKYNICLEYFVEKKTSIQLARKYNYSSDGIIKIASRINQKIKGLFI